MSLNQIAMLNSKFAFVLSNYEMLSGECITKRLDRDCDRIERIHSGRKYLTG